MTTKIRASISGIRPRIFLRNTIFLSIGAVLAAINFNIFLAPSKLAPGGVSAIALIINRFSGWPLGLTLFALAIPLLFVGFQYLGRFNFLLRTLYVTVIYTFSVDLLTWRLPAEGITADPLLNALFGGVLGGIATGLVFRGRGAFAGTGIISRILQLKTGIPVTQFYMMIDGAIIVALGLTFGWENALYSVIMLFIWGLATDYALEGPSVIRTAFIVTDSPHPVADTLINRMGIGVTAWQGEGMYTNHEHTVLFCTISRPDVETLRSVITEVDDKAFIVIGQGHQSSGGVLKPRKSKSNFQ
ncbi:MAG TPA: YitT family protein [Caldilineae bacterium]|nr:YitT family protein [Caldilineae bacterium]